MKVAVLGAGGKAGKELVAELRRRDHHVIAVGRNAGNLPEGDGIEQRVADVSDASVMAEAVAGADAVMSGLKFDISANTVVEGVKRAGIDRLIVTGGAASLHFADGMRIYDMPGYPDEVKRMVLPGIHYLDWIKLEKELNWSFFSPSRVLFEGPRTGKFRLSKETVLLDDAGESRISYADAAIAMVDELEQGNNPRGRWTAGY